MDGLDHGWDGLEISVSTTKTKLSSPKRPTVSSLCYKILYNHCHSNIFMRLTINVEVQRVGWTLVLSTSNEVETMASQAMLDTGHDAQIGHDS